jgi:hypothetical protein
LSHRQEELLFNWKISNGYGGKRSSATHDGFTIKELISQQAGVIQSAGVHRIETCCAVSNSKLLQKCIS